MTKFSLWTERVSVSLPGAVPKFPARGSAPFLPERYSAPRRARHYIVLSAFPRAKVCLSNRAQLRTPRSRALCQNSRRAALLRSYPVAIVPPGERGIALFSQPCLVPKFAFQTGRNYLPPFMGAMPKCLTRGSAPFLPGRYSETPGERGITSFSQPFPVPKFAFQTGRNCLPPVPKRHVKILACGPAPFLPRRYSAPRRARHYIVLSALLCAKVCLSNGAQLLTPRSQAPCQNSGMRPCSVPTQAL